MNIVRNHSTSQPPLPMQDVAKTQSLKEQLDTNEAARHDLRDILTLTPEEAQDQISSRDDYAVRQIWDSSRVSKLAPSLANTGLALAAAGLSACATLGLAPLSLAAVAGGLLFTGAGLCTALRSNWSQMEAISNQAEVLDKKEQLVNACRKDPLLSEMLSKNAKWMEENKAPNLPASPDSGPKRLSLLSGAANVLFRAPDILVTPAVNALKPPRNQAEEYQNEVKGRILLSPGIGALKGAAIGATLGAGLTLTLGTSLSLIAGSFLGVLGGNIGLMTGFGFPSVSSSLREPLNIGRETAKALPDDAPAWKKYTTGVKLAAKQAFQQG